MKNNYIVKRVVSFMFDFLVVNVLTGLFVVSTSAPYANQISEFFINMGTSPEDFTEFEVLVNKYFIASANDAMFILVVLIFYYVILAKLLGGKTLGCMLTGLKIVKTNGTKLTYSDLTVKMLFTNLGIQYIMMCIIFIPLNSYIIIASMIFSIVSILYYIFLVVNFIFLSTKGTSIVDRMSKTRPLIIMKSSRDSV